MIRLYTKPIKKIFDESFKDELETFANGLETNLTDMLIEAVVKEDWQRNYIKKVIEKRVELLTGLPSQLEDLKSDFDDIKQPGDVKHEDYKKFRDRLITVMGYTKRRSDFYPQYFQKIGVKSCVYCNALLTVAVDADEFKDVDKFGISLLKGKFVRAKFQVDHFIPKNEYPCYCVSLFNLNPVCGPCNNIKSDKKVNFKLYTEVEAETTGSAYEFALKPGCVADYLASADPEKIEIIFTDPDKLKADEFGEGSLADTFDIAGIYKTQRDIVEELILKRRVYTESYKDTLVSGLPEIFNQSDLSDRVLLGNYSAVKDIHKRPLAKFMQDIDLHIKNVLPIEVTTKPNVIPKS